MPPRDRDRPDHGLSIEAIVAIEPPREYRLHPRDRTVAFTADAAGARQLFTMPLRGGYPTQLTASERENRRDAFGPIVAFLQSHVLDEQSGA